MLLSLSCRVPAVTGVATLSSKWGIAIPKWWLSAWHLFSCIVEKPWVISNHNAPIFKGNLKAMTHVQIYLFWVWTVQMPASHEFSKRQQYLITMTRTYKKYCMPCVAKGHVSFLLRQLWLLTCLTRSDQVASSTNLLTLNVRYVSSAMWAWRWSMLAAEFSAEPNSF